MTDILGPEKRRRRSVQEKTPTRQRLRNINTDVGAAYPSIKLIRPFLHHHFTLIKISCMVVCATNIVGISVRKLGLNSIRSIAHFI